MTGWRDHVSSHALQYQPKFALQHRHQPTPLQDHSSKHTNLTSNEAFFQPFRRWCCRVALRAPIALLLSRSTSLYFTFDRLELDDISVSTLHALHFVRFLYRYHSNSCTSSALQDFEALCCPTQHWMKLIFYSADDHFLCLHWVFHATLWSFLSTAIVWSSSKMLGDLCGRIQLENWNIYTYHSTHI